MAIWLKEIGQMHGTLLFTRCCFSYFSRPANSESIYILQKLLRLQYIVLYNTIITLQQLDEYYFSVKFGLWSFEHFTETEPGQMIKNKF